MDKSIQIIRANLADPVHGKHVLLLLSEYATGIMGGGEELSPDVKQRLVPELRKRPFALVLLAYEMDTPVALSISFEGFSTFYAQPLLNIHDFVVSESHRGRGIARQMLQKLEEIAKERGCCKLTLEVLAGNERAQKVYKAFGFAPYELDVKTGTALFWNKKLL